MAERPLYMAIGMFDGLHVGHQTVIGRAVSRARDNGGLALAATFDRHPASVTAPQHVPPAIQTLNQKLRSLAKMGLDATWLIRFDKAFSEKSPGEFVTCTLTHFPGLRVVFVGEKFRFGHRRQGTVDVLRDLGRKLGFQVEAIPPIAHNNEPVSSTRIRRQIRAGHLDEARILLGRPYALAGKIVEGDQLGRQLGFPTANLAVEGVVLPPNGVYAAHAEACSWSGPAVVNIGFRPTLEQAKPAIRVEAHLIGFNGDIYGQEIELSFLGFIRAEHKFDDIEALRMQIAEDCRTAIKLYQTVWQSLASTLAGPGRVDSTPAQSA